MNKSLFKRPGAQHFTLVHRSQRDPLINDPDASDRVLKKISTRGGGSTGRSASTSAAAQDQDELEPVEDEGEGGVAADAASYGIFFEDQGEYDYLQHLRPVANNDGGGGGGGGGESYLVEATSNNSNKGKGKAKATRFEMPEEVLPSHPLDEVSYTEATQARAQETGLRLDLDPRVREVLEALDDDAYALDDTASQAGTDGDVDDFWGEVVKGGEVDEGEFAQEFDHGEDEDSLGGEWGDVKKFKALQSSRPDGASEDEEDEDFDSEAGDTIAELRAASAKRPPRKPSNNASQAGGSQFSMTSSAMYRNEGLRSLDDRFDEIEKMYETDSDDGPGWGGGGYSDDDDDGEHAGLEAHPAPREDLDAIMDDFLARFEVLGGKMRPVLEQSSGNAKEDAIGKLDRIRRELAQLDLDDEDEGEEEDESGEEGVQRRLRRREKERILQIVERQEREAKRAKKERIAAPEERQRERWDCETVLSTYSNVSNHPRMLRMRDMDDSKRKRVAKIAIDERTGFPLVDGEAVVPVPGGRKRRPGKADEPSDSEDEENSDVDMQERQETVARARNESAEEKKQRKQAVKQQRAARRTEKKAHKDAFGNETKRQKRIAGRRVEGGGAADVSVGMEGVRRLA